MSYVIANNTSFIRENEFNRVSLGFRPSGYTGDLHTGSIIPLILGTIALDEQDQGYLDIRVMDLDFNRHEGDENSVFESLLRKADQQNCHTFMKEHTMESIQTSFQILADVLGIRIPKTMYSFFSETIQEQNFGQMMLYLFTTERGKAILNSSVNAQEGTPVNLLVSPICECGYSSTKLPKISKDGQIYAKCYQKDCPVDSYETHIAIPGAVNINHLVDPIRDLIPDENGITADLHIFGGDYFIKFGQTKVPKAYRVLELMRGVHFSLDMASPPVFYVGPMATFGGVKIGKSKKNAWPFYRSMETSTEWLENIYSQILNNHVKDNTIELS